MNATILRLELLRVLRDPVTMFFTAVLPAFLYLIFGASQDYKSEWLAGGNVGMYIMVGMAAYGAVTATTGLGGMTAVERVQGWGRQLGLTPLSDGQFIAIRAVVAVLVSLVPVALVYLCGALTGARADGWVWVATVAIVVAGSVTWSLFGLAVGLAFRSEASVSAASGSLVIFSFLGNLFFPLSGWLLTLAKFTPLYGYAWLARWPVNEGVHMDSQGNLSGADPVWQALLNLVVWTVAFAAAAVLLVRRGRSRQ